MDPERLSDEASDLRTTAASIKGDAERLAEIEATKISLHPQDPTLVELSRESEMLGARIADQTKVETELVKETLAKAGD
jgi:hypothetical protein